MARRRYQKGSLVPKTGLPKNGLWIGRWREDVIQPDGTITRPYKWEVLGTVEDYPTRKLALRALASHAPKLAVLIFDFAHLDGSVLLRAKKVATQIFKESGIETEWFDCPASPECDLQAERAQFRLIIQSQVRKAVKDHSQAKKLTDSDVLGFAIPCQMTDSACLFYMFYSPISSLARQYEASTGCILGQVIVHEIGHSLLGPDAHSRTGIMQPGFHMDEADRLLYFSSRESKRAQDQLSMRNESVKNRFAGLSAPLLLANSKN